MSAAVNVRRIMAGHHRKLCCPLLKKFVNECLLFEEDKFVTRGAFRSVQVRDGGLDGGR